MKIRAMISTVVLALLLAGNAAYADADIEKAGAGVRGAIEQEFIGGYADSLDAQKDNFHGKGKSSFHEATVGEGVPYYQLNVSGESLTPEWIGYKFPLYLDGTQVAVIEATQESGTWKIFNISNHNDFQSTLERLKAAEAGDSAARLIDDKRYEFNYLYTNDAGNERYIDLANDQDISPSEIMDVIIESSESSQMNRNSTGGAILVGGSHQISASAAGDTFFLPAVLFGLSLAFAVPVVVYFIRRRRAADGFR